MSYNVPPFITLIFSICPDLSFSRSRGPLNSSIVSHCRESDRLSGILLLPLLRRRLVDAPELDGSRIDPCQQAAYRRQFAGNACVNRESTA